jgi:hypothetical protein
VTDVAALPGQQLNRRAQWLQAAACFTLVAAALTGPALLGLAALGPDTLLDSDPLYGTGPAVRQPPWSEFASVTVDLPRTLTFARHLHAGRFQTWNPLSGAGAPLWAEQGDPFFPLKLPVYLVPSARSHALYLTLRLVAAALGAYYLARYRGLSHLAALAAAAAYELSGALLDMLSLSQATGPFLLPWVLLGVAAIARRRDGVATAGAAVALGLTGGGHPTIAMTIYAAFAIAVAAHACTHWRTPRAMGSIAALGVVAMILGVAVAAVTLLPLIELSRLAVSYKDTAIGEFSWQSALNQSRFTLAPALFTPALLQEMRVSHHLAYAAAPMLGVTALVLAGAGVLSGGLGAPLAGVGVLGFALATMPGPLVHLHEIPFLRYVLPYYAWALVALPLTQAVGRGVERLETGVGRWTALATFAPILAGSTVLLFTTDYSSVAPLLDATGWWNRGLVLRLQGMLAQPAGVARAVAPAACAAAAIAVAFIGARRGRVRAGAVAASLLVIGEGIALWWPVIVQPRSAVLSAAPSPALEFLRSRLADGQTRFIGVPYTVGHPLTPLLFDLRDFRGVSALPARRYVEYLRAFDPNAAQFTLQQPSVRTSPLLDLAAVRFVAVRAPTKSPPAAHLDEDPQLALAYADDRVAIYENHAAVPRFRLVHQAEVVQDARAATERIGAWAAQGGHAGELGLADRVIIEPDAAGQLPPLPGAASRGAERVRVVSDDHPDRLALEVDVDTAGFLVVADTYHPGWNAWLDGEPTPIYPADLMFRAIFVPAGSHAIELRYQPRSFTAGALISALALIVCAAMTLPARAARGTAVAARWPAPG